MQFGKKRGNSSTLEHVGKKHENTLIFRFVCYILGTVAKFLWRVPPSLLLEELGRMTDLCAQRAPVYSSENAPQEFCNSPFKIMEE